MIVVTSARVERKLLRIRAVCARQENGLGLGDDNWSTDGR